MPLEDWQILDLLAGLVEKSLVVFEETPDGGGRYRLLETVRQYGRDRLLETGEGAFVRENHRRFFAEMTAQAELGGPAQAAWLARLELEHDNLRAALEWSAGTEKQLTLAASLAGFWNLHAHLSEGRTHLENALTVTASPAQKAERADALHGAATLATHQCDFDAARRLLDESLTLAQELGDVSRKGRVYLALGNIAIREADFDAARRCYEQSLADKEAVGDRRGIAAALHSLGNVWWRLDDNDAAQECYERSAQIRTNLGDKLAAAQTWGQLGRIARGRDDWATVARIQQQILPTFHALGVSWAVALALEDSATMAHAQGRAAVALRLLSASDALRARIGFPIPDLEKDGWNERAGKWRAALPPGEAEAAWAKGQTLSLEDAVAAALADAALVLS